MCKIHTLNGILTYAQLQKAMEDKPFTMSLTDTAEIEAVTKAVNQGIDAHLEACFCPERGDKFERGKRMAGKSVLCYTLECTVSKESLPVLLRRLFALADDDTLEAGERLGSDILDSLGLSE